ncbi:MAG: nucleotide 5'-monophosphate nucleosidase PpnN [Gammaproteobacteria bacterium]
MNKIKECSVRPPPYMNMMSQREIMAATQSDDEVFQTFRNCALAVLNTGNDTDDAAALLKTYADFSIDIITESRGIKLQISNAPASAFVDGKMIRGVQEHLFAALRDIVYTQDRIKRPGGFEIDTGPGITDAVFRILRNAGIVRPNMAPNLVVCWGGHSISREEYDYSKLVGYQLGLRGMDIVTGCGIGAMKGPMKGALIGHAKQKNKTGRYIGISEPGIIASESPNPTVNELVILPDIEKRLEAFVRLGHSFVVFPGGVGTIEEILYLLGLALREKNSEIPLPLLFTAPAASAGYFEALDRFLRDTLGDEVAGYYEIVIDNPEQVAQRCLRNLNRVVAHRRKRSDSYAYNWSLEIPEEMQHPFVPTHDSMAALKLDLALPRGELITQLRSAYSGIVAGNVKAFGIRQIEEKGPFKLNGDAALMAAMDKMLGEFASSKRMKLAHGAYNACYELNPLPGSG